MKELKPPQKHTKICDNCRGNGYITVIDNQNKTNVHQCWECESEGEIRNYDQAEVDDFIYNFYYRKRLQ
jgi:DnaJ-class molecular chaperone